MRIIHLAPHCNEDGNGVVNVAVDLASAQADAGHTVGFASNGGSLLGLLQKHSVQHFAIDMGLRNPIAIVRSFLALRLLVRTFKPQIVHAHMVPGALFGRILRWVCQFRLVTTVHNAPKRQSVAMGLADIVIVVSAANQELMSRRGIPMDKMRIVKNGPLGSPRRAPVNSPNGEVALRRPAIVTVARLFTQKGIPDLSAAFD
jgi:hypothetical protein